MFDIKSHLGVQSWCFRHFKTADALIQQIKSIGLAYTELCAVHADFENEASFDATIAQFKTAGIQITSIGVQRFKADEPTEEKWFKFCKLAGAKMISATFDIASVPQSYRTAEKLAEKYDLLIGIHNHGGYHWLGNSDSLKHAFHHTSNRIGLCLDSAWCLQSGEDPLKWADQFQTRLFSTHIKDFTFLPTGQGEDVVVGTGNLKLKEYLTLILKAPNLVASTLEYEADVENPGPKLKDCVTQVAMALN